jgi:hypothetical protein
MALASGGGEGDKKDGLFQDTGKVTFKPGSGITFDGGDEFRLNLKTTMAIHYTAVGNDSNNGVPPGSNFSIRRAEMVFSGNAYNKNLLYKLNVDPTTGATNTTDAPVKDAWAQWNFNSSDTGMMGVRVGQSKTMFGLESAGYVGGLYFVERSSATKTFSDVRSRGAWLFGANVENKLRWNVGAQNGDVSNGAAVADKGEDANNADNELSYVANVSFDPWGDVTGGKTNEAFLQGDLDGTPELRGTFGLGVMIGNDKAAAAPNGPDDEARAYNVNAAIRVKNFGVQGEFFSRKDDIQGGASTDASGWYLQGTYTMPKSGESPLQWGFGIRYSMINISDTGGLVSAATTNTVAAAGLGTTQGDASELTFGINAFYHGHNAKTQLNYTIQTTNPDAGVDSTNGILQVCFQLVF